MLRKHIQSISRYDCVDDSPTGRGPFLRHFHMTGNADLLADPQMIRIDIRICPEKFLKGYVVVFRKHV
jgi:hypothetical protein